MENNECEHKILHRGWIEEGKKQYSYYYCKECETVLVNLLSVTNLIDEAGIEHDRRMLEDAKNKFEKREGLSC